MKLLAVYCRYFGHKWKMHRANNAKQCKRCGLVRDIKRRAKS